MNRLEVNKAMVDHVHKGLQRIPERRAEAKLPKLGNRRQNQRQPCAITERERGVHIKRQRRGTHTHTRYTHACAQIELAHNKIHMVRERGQRNGTKAESKAPE